jgi:hypothetical protein
MELVESMIYDVEDYENVFAGCAKSQVAHKAFRVDHD